MIGPPYRILGDPKSKRSCVAITILARSLQDRGQVALCRFVKQKDADPILGILCPFSKSSFENSRSLFFIRMPFADDQRNLKMPSLSKKVSEEQRKASDSFVESLMLSRDDVPYRHIANPCVRALTKTVMNRAIEPCFEICELPRALGTEKDPMATPPVIIQKSSKHVRKFLDIFPRKNIAEETFSNGRKKKRTFWLS